MKPADTQKSAQQLNELAANIQTPADAKHLVDSIADLFSDLMPVAWSSASLRNRLAQAEFSAVSDPSKHIPEQRLAGAWNVFVETIHAPGDQKATAAEIHNLRDALFTTARISWNLGHNNIWAIPSVYATEPDGKLASGCRAIESIRILWDLANMPGNLETSRDRVREGVLASDLYRQPQRQQLVATTGRVSFHVGASKPIELACRQFIHTNGMKAFNNAVFTLLNSTFA